MKTSIWHLTTFLLGFWLCWLITGDAMKRKNDKVTYAECKQVVAVANDRIGEANKKLEQMSNKVKWTRAKHKQCHQVITHNGVK